MVDERQLLDVFEAGKGVLMDEITDSLVLEVFWSRSYLEFA